MAESRRDTSGLALLVRPDRMEAAWWRAWTQDACEEARRKLFDHHRKLADSIALAQHGKRPPGTHDLGDVRQLAYEGLIQAITRFDPTRAVPFSAFARMRITGNIANGLASMSEASAQYAYARRVERDRLRSLEPSPAETSSPISALAGLASRIALGLMLENREPVEPDTIPTPAPDAYQSLAWRDMQERLTRALEQLSDREAYVLRQHYHHAVNFVQIAGLLGVTKGRVSQIHRAALDRLRQILGEVG
ncbi:sigma-70 family RNA polymerase sigma factor [Pelagerythrobacter marensis]|uniref:RNA polymerase sigma factor n=1 Tax=Pelagerythrobacter marensis TaxID=543877 RepID=A0A0G3X9V0_9SPHN|nr:sigma-70 family RNA polymerase sigma factor [Pelagerythrobacter marensis]AKM07977.1 RNA polymerase sigma factor [Pelagerythrobacter marensis]